MNMPWGADFSLPYSSAPWFHNSYMSYLPTYLRPNYITYKELASSEPSPKKMAVLILKIGLCRKENTR